MKLAIAIVLAALASPALAQQPTPAQLAIQIDNAVNGMAQQIEQLQAQLAQAQAHIKKLEDEKTPKDAEPKK